MEVSTINAFLKQQCITASSKWIGDCISFGKQLYGQNISMEDLKKHVLDQWIYSDLEEIGVPCLPPESSTAHKMTLHGTFVLQVQGIRDIGQPAYSQLKELERKENENSEFSAAPAPTVPPWESKPTRMLLLNLTDGHTYIQGMEYKPLSSFSPDLPPGVKVLIQGPVDCRLGRMLLSSEKIKILGGDVESKLTQYSRKNLLREVLELDIPDAEDEESNTVPSNNSYPSSSGVSSLPPTSDTDIPYQNHPAAHNDIETFEEDDFEQSLDYGALDEIEQECVRNSGTSEVGNAEQEICPEDEDMMNEMMAFQDQHDGFEMPSIPKESLLPKNEAQTEMSDVKHFDCLSSVLKNVSKRKVATIKGYGRSGSKLELTTGGWSLSLKITDGTATVVVDVHNKVLENIIGVSASAMVEIKRQASKNPEKIQEIQQATKRIKSILHDHDCLIDIELQPNTKPCLIKCTPLNLRV